MMNVVTEKVRYRDEVFTVIPASSQMGIRQKQELAEFVQSVGDVAFMVDRELYVSENGMFHIDIKFCDKYNFI